MLTTRTALTELQQARRASGMTLEKIGEALNRDTSTISRWLRGQSPVTLDEIDRLSKALRQPITLRFGQRSRRAAPDVSERLERIEGLVRAIAAATPGVKLPYVEETIARVDATESSQQQLDALHPKAETRTPDE